MAVKSYVGQNTVDIISGENTQAARSVLPRELYEKSRAMVSYLNAAARLEDIQIRRGWKLKKLGDDRVGQLSIRINDQFRICFRWVDNEAENVEIVDYH